MKLILPFPPSVNTYWRHPNKGAFAGKSLISAAGRKFQSAACAAIVEQLRRLPKPTSAPASVEIVLFPPDNRIRDLDNYNKALFDALTHAGVWEDDSQVKRMLVEWGPVTARNYNGTYSAQRQELVESTDGYLILQDWFIGAVTRPMYRAWLKQAVASGVIRLPRDLDRSSLYTAVYSGPVMPWIDPVKEAEAWKIQIRGGAATESDWVRAGGRNPDDVKRRRKAEIDENRKLDLVFDTDPASDKGGSSAATKRQEPQHTDDQSEE